MRRRTFLQSFLPPAAPPPNVLLILADEWRAQSTGYAADPNVHTPALDRLASQSVNFHNAVSGHPVCCPYRASLMTGQFPLTHGLFLNDEEFRPQTPTLGQVFARAGYRTGYIGKWHLYGSPEGNYERREAFIPRDRRFGFDYWKACECTHTYNHSLYYQDDDPTPRYWPGYDAFAQTDDARAFIRQSARSRDPFFLVLSLGPPHFPLNTAPEKYRLRYRNRDLQLRPNVPDRLRDQAVADLRGYSAHIAAVDDCIARLLATLDAARVSGHTIVVFTSDHGDMMRSQGLATKHVPWDESVRVPFLLRDPRKLGPRGRRVDAVLNTPDILPTLLSLCGLPVPGAVQGIDYSGLCAGAPPPADSAAFLQFPVSYGAARSEGIGEYRGLRTRQYTYVRSLRGPWLLYDNAADPYQMRNLCGRPEHRVVQFGLDRALDACLKKYGDDFLPGPDYVARFGYGHNREISGKPGHSVSPWGDWEATL